MVPIVWQSGSNCSTEFSHSGNWNHFVGKIGPLLIKQGGPNSLNKWSQFSDGSNSPTYSNILSLKKKAYKRPKFQTYPCSVLGYPWPIPAKPGLSLLYINSYNQLNLLGTMIWYTFQKNVWSNRTSCLCVNNVRKVIYKKKKKTLKW